MTEVIHSPSSSSSPSISTPTHNASLFLETQSHVEDEGISGLKGGERGEEEEESRAREKSEKDRRDQLSLLALLLTLIRKSLWLNCKTDKDDLSGDAAGGSGSEVMEIGWPTDVEHVNHVVFDRYDGFLGLPVEFEPEVPRRAPSASTSVFGVSTESMQLSYDSRGNSIPTILLLLQRHLYSQGGLQAEGIFRITAGNSQEEYVREQLNGGVVPEGVDVHCLAGLIKAWFRELPRGVLDSLSHYELMQCASEDDCDALVQLLPSTEAALLDWAINLMADVVQEENRNKMNERNIAMVFAPNMTKMSDPLNALMHAVQVMNFLKTLIEKNLRARGESTAEASSISRTEPSDDSGNQSAPQLNLETPPQSKEKQVTHPGFTRGDASVDSRTEADQALHNVTDEDYFSYSTSSDDSDGSVSCGTPAERCQATRGGLQDQFEENDTIRSELSFDSIWTKTECRTGYMSKGISNLNVGSMAVNTSPRLHTVTDFVTKFSLLNS